MIPNHVIDPNDAVEYLKQFGWVKDFDSVIIKILDNGNTIDEEKDDEDKNV